VYKGDTALHLACSRGYTGVADALIEAGANVNARGTEGETPLMVAARTNNAL